MVSHKQVSKLRQYIPALVSYLASSGSLFAASVAQLLTFAILARSLGAYEFGMFITIMAVTSIAVHLCGLGGSESLVRRVAQNRDMYPVMLGHNLILITITSLPLLLLGVIILPLWIKLSPDLLTDRIILLVFLIANVPVMRLILLVEQIYIARSDFKAANISVVGFALARTAAAILACLVFNVTDVVNWAIWQLVCHLLVAVLYWYLLRTLGKPVFRLVREEIKLGLFFATPFIFRAIRQNIDLLLLGMLLSPTIIGSYGVARRIIDSSYMNIEAMNRLLYPRFAKLTTNGIDHAWPMAKKTTLIAILLGAITSLSVFIVAPYLPILFGQEYTSLVYFCQILCWTTILVAIWSIAVEVLGASGNHAYRASILNVGNIVGAPLLAFATWLIPPQGTFISIYLIELSIAVASWWVLYYLVKKSRQRRALSAVSAS